MSNKYFQESLFDIFGGVTASPIKEETPKKQNKAVPEIDCDENSEEFLEEEDFETDELDETPAKSVAPKSKSKKAAPATYSLPLKVVSSTWHTQLDTVGTFNNVATLEEITKYLYESGYYCVAHSHISSFYESGTLFLGLSNKHVHPEDTLVVLDNKTIRVSDGQLNAEYTRYDFSEFEADEISVLEVQKKWVQTNPQYEGCVLNYDESTGILIPCFDAEEVALTYPIKVYINNSPSVYMKEHISDESALGIASKIFGKLPSKVKASLFKNDLGSGYFLSFNITGGVALDNRFAKNNVAKVSKAVERYALPFTLYLANMGIKLSATKETFSGKEKVSLEDIITALKSKYSVFKDSSRTPMAMYVAEENIVSISFASGKLGYALPEAQDGMFSPLIRTFSEYLDARLSKNRIAAFYGDEATNPYKRTKIVTSTPLGVFEATQIGSFQSEYYCDFTYEQFLPKIPCEVLENVISYFRADLQKEAVVRIIFDTKANIFQIVRPVKDNATKSTIEYVFPPIWPHEVLVIELHSHTTDPAIFSKIDDADNICTGLYGVIGKLDRTPEISIRLSYMGTYSTLPMQAVFEGGCL